MYVLIVDDDTGIRELLCQVLEDEAFTTATCFDGADALEYLRTADSLPCTILLDLMMPRMDGWAFRQAQLQDPVLATIPVIVLSARPDLAAQSQVLGVTNVLSKPIDLMRLVMTVQAQCGGTE